MEVELRRLVELLRRAEDEGEQEEVARQISADLHGAQRLAAKKADVQELTGLALATPNSDVRKACIRALVTLVPLVEKGNKVFGEDILDVCFAFADDREVGSACLDILVSLLDSTEPDHATHLREPAVERGAIDLILRAIQQAARSEDDDRVVDKLFGGLAALASEPTYALELHVKGIWFFLREIYDTTQRMTTNFFMLMHSGTRSLLHSPFCNHRASTAAQHLRNTARKSSSLSGLDGASEFYYEPSHGYSAQRGLLDDSKLGADTEAMDLASEVCYQISSTGLLQIVLHVVRRTDHDRELFSTLSLDIIHVLAPAMHKTVPEKMRIQIVRAMVKIIPSFRDGRLGSVVNILDALARYPANQGIICQCGAVQTLAQKGSQLLQRHDPETRRLCALIVDFFNFFSTLPEGPAELSAHACVRFLQEAMADIADVRIKSRPRSTASALSIRSSLSAATSASSAAGDWMSSMEFSALLALTNIALQSPMMTSVTEANLHHALVSAAARQDELGLMAVLASAFFLGRSTGAYSSREFPRLQHEHVLLLSKLFDDADEGETTFGAAEWSISELLEALQYLALAPHNGSELQPVLPGVLATLRRALKAGPEPDADLIGLIVKVLLTMSYHKEVMSGLMERRALVEKLLLQARKALPSFYLARRDVETLLTSIESEEIAQERSPYRFGAAGMAQGFVKRVSRSLARASLTRMRASGKVPA
ncbi:Hypothetical Protein FCC1311_043672 [Hondaea fermentalgiana]|uniref:Uncharacterized protein n=1 Tax=Hondaea fermentalgiana TaxID=2315210 RepID=A0A2R5GJV5_9STRA|nr:Hypothetical Protein FCC1311_043672 [Hondaea fermentalgiana]|eukprot:GBG28144.1 Hypothetical Protein FCC1311_043672 [Hondaea fermentalgiana]